ncbi:hypothetical protein [Agrobacterium tumefaciens]|uniref:hypothetical protein n=1 Tax=Agrobacterium tumefaciens TaxID=358 RepID=UPI000459B3FA|nr:hypothetical protein [Agrobacterium tumefaciens]CDN96500.1 hypothetical protein BN949_05679 [Agrobacterium tumefaciens]
MTQRIETHAVEFGQFGKDYADAAERLGISQAGAFILATYKDMKNSGDIDEPVVRTAREQLLALADDIEENGVKGDRRQQVAELVRYLSQFALERPVPSQ